MVASRHFEITESTGPIEEPRGISVDRKSMEQLKFDRRLFGRRNWISREELERELESLPDSTSKIAVDEGEPSEATDGGEPV